MSELIVEFLGDVWQLDTCERMVFGREGELVIDENPYLHRHLGEFVHRDGMWWLHNLGQTISIELHDHESALMTLVPPAKKSAIFFDHFRICFEAGTTTYELGGSLTDPPGCDVSTTEPSSGLPTADFGRVPLTLEQRMLILALAEPRLLDIRNTDAPIPTNREAAARLGWTLTKLNRKLDNVCDKFSKKGVPGLHGNPGGLATDRRRRLVDHAVTSGVVTPDDLAVFEEA